MHMTLPPRPRVNGEMPTRSGLEKSCSAFTTARRLSERKPDDETLKKRAAARRQHLNEVISSLREVKAPVDQWLEELYFME